MACSCFPSGAPASGDPRCVGAGGPATGGAGPVSARPGRPVRLLVADDDARVRAAIVQTITLEAGLVLVASAADAAAALVLAERTGPSVTLVDVMLPDEATGLALVRSLARRPGCAVVAMSIRGGLRAAALAAGAAAFVEKGDIDAVLAAVRAAAPPHRSLTTPAGASRQARSARCRHSRRCVRHCAEGPRVICRCRVWSLDRCSRTPAGRR